MLILYKGLPPEEFLREPEIMRAASISTLFSSSTSYWLQPSQTESGYANTGRVCEKYTLTKDILSTEHFNIRSMLAFQVSYHVCYSYV